MTDTTTTSVRVRFAPSPTGKPHVGNIRTALFNWLFARHHGGTFILRIEDTDRERYDPEAERSLFAAMRWLGLEWDEGPEKGGEFGPYHQSQRTETYREVTDELIRRGQAYRCYCTRERIQAIREARQQANVHPYGYDRHCRALSENERAALEAAGTPYVVRFAIPAEGETSFEDAIRGRITYSHRELDDHVLLKSDGFPTYQLANVVDDHLMQVTHVLRAEEWIPSTPRHVLLYQAMGWEMPIFAHLTLILGPDKKKLSKRHGATSVEEFQEQGYLPEALGNFLSLLGWSPGNDQEVMSAEERTRLFSLDGITRSPAVFDIQKLNWMNGLYIRQLSREQLLEQTLPYLQKAGLVPAEPSAEERAYAMEVVGLEQERLETLTQTPEVTEFFFKDPPEYDPAATRKWLEKSEAGPVLDRIAQRLEQANPWAVDAVEAAVRGVIEELQVKGGLVIHPTRVAATGRTVGPGLFETLHVLGQQRVVRRIREAREGFVPATEGTS